LASGGTVPVLCDAEGRIVLGASDELENLSSVALSGQYDDLEGRPSLSPVATGGRYEDLQDRPSFSEVAFSGQYASLSGRPQLKPVATLGRYSDLAERPDLAVVALSGEYDDLSGLPSLADIATSGDFFDLEGRPRSVRWRAGQVVPLVEGSVSVGTAVVANTLEFVPFIAPVSLTFNELGVRLATAAATAFVQLAIYEADANGEVTGPPIATTGSLSGAAAAVVSGPAVGSLVEGRMYFTAGVASVSIAFQSFSPTQMNQAYKFGAPSFAALSPSNTQVFPTRSYLGSYGTWPDMTGVATNYNAGVPRSPWIMAKIATVA
jgi:hypothetical protein